MKNYTTREEFIEDLKNLVPNGRAVEIGVHKGSFSKHILKNWEGKLFMVDVWRRLGPSYDEWWKVSDEDLYYNYINEAIKNIKEYDGRAIIMRTDSKTACEIFADESLDFIFIDADHAYDCITEDLRLWFPKLKKGGIFSGHDYINMDWYNDPNFCENGKDKHIWILDGKGGSNYSGVFGVNPAVDEFCNELGYQLNKTTEWFGTWWFRK